MKEDPFNEIQKAALDHVVKMMDDDILGYNRDYVSFEKYEEIFNSMGDLLGKTVIDIGSGPVPISADHMDHGTFLLPIIEEKGATLIPIDLEHINAKTWNLLRGDDQKLAVAPLTTNAFIMPFKNESIDVGVSVNLINFPWSAFGMDCHEGAYRLLQEIFRVIKKGGSVVISSFGYYKYTMKDGSIVYNNDIPQDQILTSAEIRQIAVHAGFTDVSEIPLDEKRIGSFSKHLNSNKEYDVLKVETVEPCAFLLKK